MPGRKSSSTAYKYGFNGKEKDDEVSGSGNQYDYGFRIYNPRIAKFLSVDPLTQSYPWYTPYQFAGNKPIIAIDLDGLEEFFVYMKVNNGKVTEISIEKNNRFRAQLAQSNYPNNCIRNRDLGSAQYIITNEHGVKSYSKVYSRQEFEQTYEYKMSNSSFTGYDGRVYSNEFKQLGQKVASPSETRTTITTKIEQQFTTLFEINKSALGSDETEALDQQVNLTYNLMSSDVNTSVKIEGFTSRIGSDEYNQNLSQARANYVKEKLVGKGINPDRIQAVGYGESQSTNPDGSDIATDRKVTSTVSKTPPPSTLDICGD